MRLSFRPLPGLTVATVIAVAILVWLGTWQYQRLQWKTKLLAEVDAAAEASPFTSLPEVQSAIDAGEPVDFRRIGFKAEYVDGAAPYLVFTAQNGVSWRPFYPVKSTSSMTTPTIVFAAEEVFPDAERDIAAAPRTGAVDIAGYVRLDRPENTPFTKSTPEQNRWFGFNPMPDTHSWAKDLPGADMRFYIDAVPGQTNASDLPPKRPDIRNAHLDYMLTWYGLALVLIIMYLYYHRREGRLTWR